jgi:hypothetical protein
MLALDELDFFAKQPSEALTPCLPNHYARSSKDAIALTIGFGQIVPSGNTADAPLFPVSKFTFLRPGRATARSLPTCIKK